MKTLNFEQMERINGGDCFWKGTKFLVGAILSLASSEDPPLAAAGWILTADAYVDYFTCRLRQME